MAVNPHSTGIAVAAIAVTTSAAGAFSATTLTMTGRVLQYRYVPDPSTPLATGTNMVIAGATTAVAIVTASSIGTSAFQKAPRQPTHAVADGSALLYAAGGTAQSDFIYVDEPLTLTITSGGNALKGTFYIWVG